MSVTAPRPGTCVVGGGRGGFWDILFTTSHLTLHYSLYSPICRISLSLCTCTKSIEDFVCTVAFLRIFVYCLAPHAPCLTLLTLLTLHTFRILPVACALALNHEFLLHFGIAKIFSLLAHTLRYITHITHITHISRITRSLCTCTRSWISCALWHFWGF